MDLEKVPPPVMPTELEASSGDRTWATLAHLSLLIGATTIIAPLIIWIVKKDSAFIEDQAKEALNFQLSALIASLVLAATVCGSPLVLVVLIMSIVYSIQAGMSANRGERFRYPYTFRMIN